jgi:tRNA (guanine37-N1)-methyltransferase
MKINLLTLFPDFFSSPFESSILSRAIQQEIINVDIHNLREWGEGKHKQVDDTSYGGGPGMVLMPGPLIKAIKEIKAKQNDPPHVILMTPQGEKLDYDIASKIAARKNVLIICGKYEGIDERVVENYIDQEISLADVVFSGGEIAALSLVDAVSRLIPGVLGQPDSLIEESFCDNLLEYPQYTKPATIDGLDVPEVLLSGNHKNINEWRQKQRLIRTANRRKDLLEKKELTSEEKQWLVESNDET